MDFNLDDFVPVTKMARVPFTLVDCVRVGSSHISIAGNIFDNYASKDEPNEALIALSYNEKAQALMLERAEDFGTGYAYKRDKNGNHAKGPLPTALKHARIPRGTYKVVGEQHPNIFVLSEEDPEATMPLLGPEEKYREETAEIEVGDIVAWPYRADRRRGANKELPTMLIATGEVVGLRTDINDIDKIDIRPYTHKYIDLNPGRARSVSVTKEMLIIREKHNAS